MTIIDDIEREVAHRQQIGQFLAERVKLATENEQLKARVAELEAELSFWQSDHKAAVAEGNRYFSGIGMAGRRVRELEVLLVRTLDFAVNFESSGYLWHGLEELITDIRSALIAHR